MKPQIAARRTHPKAPARSASQIGTWARRRSVKVYAPRPTKAACPRESCPAQPPMRSQAVARAANSTSETPKLSAPGSTNGYKASTRTATPIPTAARPRRCTRWERRTASDTRRPEKSLRADEQHEEERDQAERVAITGGAEARANGFDDTEEQSAPDRPDDASHPSQDRHDECLQGEDSAHRGEDVERGQEQHARRHGEDDSDPEDRGLHEARVDALQLRRVAVLRRAADGAP